MGYIFIVFKLALRSDILDCKWSDDTHFDSENITVESSSLNRFRIIETHLYIDFLWSVVIFIR